MVDDMNFAERVIKQSERDGVPVAVFLWGDKRLKVGVNTDHYKKMLSDFPRSLCGVYTNAVRPFQICEDIALTA
jgi:hypothetical protein